MVSLMDPTHIFAPKWLSFSETPQNSTSQNGYPPTGGEGNSASGAAPPVFTGGNDFSPSNGFGQERDRRPYGAGHDSIGGARGGYGRQAGPTPPGGKGGRGRETPRAQSSDDVDRYAKGQRGPGRGVQEEGGYEDRNEGNGTRGYRQRASFEQNFPSLGGATDRIGRSQPTSQAPRPPASAWGVSDVRTRTTTRAPSHPQASSSNPTTASLSPINPPTTLSMDPPLSRNSPGISQTVISRPPAGTVAAAVVRQVSAPVAVPQASASTQGPVMTKEFYQNLVPAKPTMPMKRLAKSKDTSKTSTTKAPVRPAAPAPPPLLARKKSSDDTALTRPTATLTRLGSVPTQLGFRTLQRSTSSGGVQAQAPPRLHTLTPSGNTSPTMTPPASLATSAPPSPPTNLSDEEKEKEEGMEEMVDALCGLDVGEEEGEAGEEGAEGEGEGENVHVQGRSQAVAIAPRKGQEEDGLASSINGVTSGASLLSRSLEEEERFLQVLGWRNDENGGGFASVITEEEMAEFRLQRANAANLSEHRHKLIQKLQQQKQAPLDSLMAVTEEELLSDESSSDSESE